MIRSTVVAELMRAVRKIVFLMLLEAKNVIPISMTRAF
jgi:hypothetical protein